MKLQNLLPQQWAAMTPYQRFESVAAIAMMLLVTLVIVVAVIRMASDVISGLVLGVLNPLDNKVFQGVFGDIVTLLIALEFNHSLQYAVKGKRSIVQTKLILLIASWRCRANSSSWILKRPRPGPCLAWLPSPLRSG